MTKFHAFREELNQITSLKKFTSEQIIDFYYRSEIIDHVEFVPLAVTFLKKKNGLNTLLGYEMLASQFTEEVFDTYYDFLDKLSPKTAYKFADLIEFNIHQVFLINGFSVDEVWNEKDI